MINKEMTPDRGNQGSKSKEVADEIFKHNYNTRNIKRQVEYYFSLGFSPIPLIPFTKVAITKKWQYVDPTKLWKDFRANIGLRMGNGLICIDADSADTVQFFDDEFKIRTKVQTKRGAHYYFKTDPLFDYGTRKTINNKTLSGDFRFYRSYVVAPISYITDKQTHLYTLEEGSFDSIPYLDPNDLHRLITTHTAWKPVPEKPVKIEQDLTPAKTSLYIPVKFRPQPQLVKDKVEWLKNASKGEGSEFGDVSYPSRSEVYISVVNILVRYNWTKDEIRQLLTDPYDTAYFNRIYDAVIQYLERSNVVETLHNLYLINHPTKGEGLVYKALISFAFQFMRYSIKMSNAELRRLTGIKSHSTIIRILDRLEKRELIDRDGWVITIRGKETNTNKIKELFVDMSISLPQNSDIGEVLNLEYVIGKETSVLV